MQRATHPLATRLISWLLALLAASLLLLWSTSVRADDKTIAVKIEGPQSASFRKMIVDMVPEGIEVQKEGQFRVAMARVGLPGGNMGFALTSQSTRKTLFKLANRAVKNEKIAGAILGRVRGGKGGPELVLIYIEAEGDPTVDEAVSLKGGAKAQQEAIAAALTPVFEGLGVATPEPEPEPQPKADEEEKKDDEQKEDEEEEEKPSEPGEFTPNQFGSELFNLQLGVEFGGRFFGYSESIANSSNIRPYDVFGVPGINVAGEVYPMATLDTIILEDIGLTVSYAHFFGLDSATADERFVFGTNWNRFTAGLRYRIRIGEKNDTPFVIGLDGKFGFLNFTFDPKSPEAPTIQPEIAKAKYLFVRAGLDARLPLVSFFALAPSLGYVHPVGGVKSDTLPADATAQADATVYQRFNGPKVYGIDMELMLVFMLPAGFEARAGAEYLRFFSSFDPQVGDAYVAGGALDQYVGLRVGAAYVF